jgi:hypothetical protein
VLEQQHLAEVLQNLRNEVLAAKLGPSEALTYMRAAVPQHNTPKPVQQSAAGGSQYAQSGITPITLRGGAYLLLSADVLEENEPDKLYLSLQRVVYERRQGQVHLPPCVRPLHVQPLDTHARTCACILPFESIVLSVCHRVPGCPLLPYSPPRSVSLPLPSPDPPLAPHGAVDVRAAAQVGAGAEG